MEEKTGKLDSPTASSGANSYNNYYKAKEDGAANPVAYKNATSFVSNALSALKLPMKWLQPTLELVARESSFNPNSKNSKSTAHGLFQFLDGTKKDYAWDGVNWNDPNHQAVAGLQYIKDRYGTPEKALEFWDKNKWF